MRVKQERDSSDTHLQLVRQNWRQRKRSRKEGVQEQSLETEKNGTQWSELGDREPSCAKAESYCDRGGGDLSRSFPLIIASRRSVIAPWE